MKTTFCTSLALALSLSATGPALLAQTSAAPVRLASVVAAPGGDSAYDPAFAKQQLDKADALFLKGNISAAQRAYKAVADMQLANNVLPGEAMWKLAELYQSEGQSRRTAVTLDKLASEAERFGDPKLQARSLLEAAILYQKAGMTENSLACAERLQPLMASPFVSADFRAEVQRRLIRG